ncbi:Ribonuclease/ribotoxin [Immersiella caudata]|uniref:Ribonuclease/ribotoxin n=1 Tax=Immersiella caudata TaxID=314043 RepID=A0AA39WFX2_9PEZI|nr:Ribonuclease/ribotoxin [Immersiella caudata]
MQLSVSLLAFGLAVVQVYAVPSTPPPESSLMKRAVDNLPPSDQFIVCPDYFYSRQLVEEAIQHAIITTPTNQPQPGNFPKRFGNNRKLPFDPKCDGKKLYEFPILKSGKIFRGGEPGPDRVVFWIYTDNPDTNPTRDGMYCGVMTHDGAPEPNGFVLCPVID